MPSSFTRGHSKKFSNVVVKRVGVNNFQSLVREALAQKICQPSIFFDGENARSGSECEFGQRAEARSDFDDEIV